MFQQVDCTVLGMSVLSSLPFVNVMLLLAIKMRERYLVCTGPLVCLMLGLILGGVPAVDPAFLPYTASRHANWRLRKK